MGTESSNGPGFDEYFIKYKDIVFRAAAHYTQNRSVAEEITQEAFLKLYLYMEHSKVENVKSWLTVIVKNMCLNYFRSRDREVVIDIIENGEGIFGHEESPEEIYFREVNQKAANELCCKIHGKMLDALYQKNKKWYEAVTLVYGMKIPQKEAAVCLGISLEVLHSTLYRARNWVKKNYRSEFDKIK